MDIITLIESLFTNFSNVWVSVIKYFSSNGDVLKYLTTTVSELFSNVSNVFDVIVDFVNKII